MQTIREPMARRRVATTIFGTDNRRAFQDTTYPWSTVGLVQTNRGSGSGVMIGPRHLLTVSHVIDWTAPAGFAADWVRFTPSFFDGNAPFGEAYGAHIYWYVQEDGDGFISGNEGDFDYAVVVLDRRLGETTGWMGARGYDDDWDSLDVWSHMGYPADLNSGQTADLAGWFSRRRHRRGGAIDSAPGRRVPGAIGRARVRLLARRRGAARHRGTIVADQLEQWRQRQHGYARLGGARPNRICLTSSSSTPHRPLPPASALGHPHHVGRPNCVYTAAFIAPSRDPKSDQTNGHTPAHNSGLPRGRSSVYVVSSTEVVARNAPARERGVAR